MGAQRVGTFVNQFWNSDLGLLKLDLGISYERETFPTEEYVVRYFRELKTP
jgi:hypothetical protein